LAAANDKGCRFGHHCCRQATPNSIQHRGQLSYPIGVDYMSHEWNCMFYGIDFYLFPCGKLPIFRFRLGCFSVIRKKKHTNWYPLFVGYFLSLTHVRASQLQFDVTRCFCHCSFVSTHSASSIQSNSSQVLPQIGIPINTSQLAGIVWHGLEVN